jgi:hypothetical protein
MPLVVHDYGELAWRIVDENPEISVGDFERRLVAESRDKTQDRSAQPVLVLYMGDHIDMSTFLKILKSERKNNKKRGHETGTRARNTDAESR